MATKKEQIDLHELYKKLDKTSYTLIEICRKLTEVKEKNVTIGSAGFIVGEAYSMLDKVSDTIDDINRDIYRILNP